MLVFEATQVQECNLCKQPRFDCDIYLSTNMADGKDGGKSLQELLSIFTILGEDEKVLFLQKCIRQCQLSQIQTLYDYTERLLAKDFAEYLPEELVERIFSYLDALTLCRAACVNNKWRRMTNSDKLWHKLCRRRKWTSFYDDPTLKTIPETSLSRSSSASLKRNSLSHDKLSYNFNDNNIDSYPLGRLCPWKEIYVRVSHLEKNWAHGCYVVKPVLRGHTQPVTCMDCDDDIIVSGSSDSTVRVWDLNTLECKTVLDDFSDGVKCLRLKGRTLVAGCSDSLIRIFETETFELIRKLDGHEGSVDHICFDGNIIASASSADRTIRIWSAHIGKCFFCLSGHTDDIEVIKLRGDTLVSASWDETVKVWDLETGVCLHSLRGHTEVIMCCQLDDEKIVTGGADGHIIIWDLKYGHLKQTLHGHAEVYCLEFNEEIIASGYADSTVKIWSTHGQLLHALERHIGIVRCISLQGKRLITGGDCKKVIVWDTERGELLNVVHRHPTSLHIMWTDSTKIITASPETPGTVTVLSYWS